MYVVEADMKESNNDENHTDQIRLIYERWTRVKCQW